MLRTINRLSVLQTISLALLAALVSTLIVASGLWNPQTAQAITAADVDRQVPARSWITGWESTCHTRLINAINNGGTPRSNVNESSPYGETSWISPRSQPNQTSVTINQNTTSVPLQIQSMIFVCGILVNNNRGDDNFTDPGARVNSTNFANDRRPNTTAFDPTGIDYAALWQNNIKINWARVQSGGGTMTEPTSSYMAVRRSATSRYWFSNALPFTYVPPVGATTSRTVTIRFNVTPIRTYHAPPGQSGAVTECVYRAGGYGAVAPTDFARCAPYETTLSIRINLIPTGTITGNAASRCADRGITGTAVDADRPSTPLRVYIFKDGAALGNIIGETFTDPANGNQFFFDLNAHIDGATHRYYALIIGVNSSGTPDGGNAWARNAGPGPPDTPIVIGSCVPLEAECGQLNPRRVEASVPFAITMSFNNTSGAGGPTISTATHRMTASLNGVPGYNNADLAFTSAPPGGSGIGRAPPVGDITINTPGVYVMTMQLINRTTNAVVVTCTQADGFDVTVVTKPYLSVYGGDVLAGGGIDASCSVDSAATIETYNTGTAPFAGAGTRLAAFAPGSISEFASRLGIGLSAKNLTFSNTTGSGSLTYGGDSGYTYCAPNYWANASGVQGSQTINGATITTATPSPVYVNGDVTITNNITYANSGTWANLSAIPSYYLIVRGNIYIDKGVTQLDGVYIALPDTGGGTIYTCTNGSSPYGPSTVPADAAGCGNHLTVNGAFVAQQVKFLRTNGTIRSASTGESADNLNIAESFVFGPEVWARPLRNFGPWSTITNQPPIL